jgi:hypothetical protein
MGECKMGERSDEEMKSKFFTAIVIALFLASTLGMSFQVKTASAPTVNLVNNGSFEYPEVTHSECWGIWASGTSGLEWTVEWTNDVSEKWDGYSRPTTAYIELQKNGIYFGLTAAEGDQWAELDSDWFGPGGPSGEPANIKIYQDLTTVPGVSYSLSFAYSPRPGALDNVLIVTWGETTVDTISASGSAAWTTKTYTVVASETTTRLMFEEDGTADGLGMLLDNVIVAPIYYTVTVNAVGNGDSLDVPIKWETEAPEGSGTGTTSFSITTSIGDVTLTAPATHVADSTFYVFEKWVVGSTEYTTREITLVDVSADVTATAHYTKAMTIDKELVCCSNWKLVDTVTVPSSGSVATSTFTLEAGKCYRLEASGTYTYWPGQLPNAGIADAEYALRPKGSYNPGPGPQWVKGEGSYPSGISYALDIVNVQDGSLINIDWDPGDTTVNSDHVYVIDYVPSTTGPISFKIWDDYYGDNSGSLTVKIYECDPDHIPLFTEVWFKMRITFHTYVGGVTGVVIKDGIGADLVLDEYVAIYGDVTWAKAGTGKMGATIVTWTIGNPRVCEDYTLDLTVHTGLNPKGKQEYTSPGPHCLNSGPVVYFTYDGTLYMLQGPSITVTAVSP